MNKDLLITPLLGLYFLALFGLAELLYHKMKVRAEYTRKLVHFGTGLLTLLFPLLLSNHWPVLFLCASFTVILLLSLKFNFLKSINAIDRVSHGSILYPVAIYLCYLTYDFYNRDLVYFYLPVLTLAICDPIAALLGKRWPLGKFRNKTLLGSGAFFISSFILTIFIFYFISDQVFQLNKVIPLALGIAAFSAATEAFSVKGVDNITIPISVILVMILFA